jgi:hypothetical protein
MTYIHASHLDVELEAELRQSQVARLVAIERARDAHRQPPKPVPVKQPAPLKQVPKQAPKKPPPSRPHRVVKTDPAKLSTPAPTHRSVPSVPPGSVVLSAGEYRAVWNLLAWFEATQSRRRA